MNPRNTTFLTLASAVALTLLGCGSSNPSSTVTVGTAGATLTAGVATLTIPAGALTKDTQVTLREAEPQHGTNRVARVEVQPHDALALGHEAHLSVKVSDSNPKVKMHHGSDDALADVEVDDRNHHSFKTNMSSLDDVEVEMEHGLSCATACAAGQECDDGVCKAHNDAAKTCAVVCDTSQECDDGVCKTHNEVETEHGGIVGTCSPTCATGLECDNGLCKAHGGN